MAIRLIRGALSCLSLCAALCVTAAQGQECENCNSCAKGGYCGPRPLSAGLSDMINGRGAMCKTIPCQTPVSQPDLFYNFYTPPCNNGGYAAQLYVSPVPTPELVGHTYVTYQPLMPHEFLYRHHRTYYRYNCNSGWTRTCVLWW